MAAQQHQSKFVATVPPILVHRGRAPFGQHQESRPLAWSNDIPFLNGFVNTIDWDQNQSDLSNLTLNMRRVTGSPWIADFRCWTRPEVAILGADQKERGLWERECCPLNVARFMAYALNTFCRRGALDSWVNTDTIGCMWTGEFDSNTLHVDGEIFISEKKTLRIQKYSPSCSKMFLFISNSYTALDFRSTHRRASIFWLEY